VIRIYLMMMILLGLAHSQPAADRILVPGIDPNYNSSSWAGLLNTNSSDRRLYYLFTESELEPTRPGVDPVTLWLNGGPGCSSLMGFLQEVGPFYLEDGVDYAQGDNLTRNEFAWTKASNLLFIEAPAGVGFSVNNSTDKTLNDEMTAKDLLAALLNWRIKFPSFNNRSFYIAGESYAGKYIPDLAMQIDLYNQNNPSSPINLKALLIGNGLISPKTL
jgi:serine carboxypeptidase-like clade 2